MGGSGPRDFLGLMDSTHLAGLVPNIQGVASPTNEENWRGRLDARTNGMMGGGGRTPPLTAMKTGRGRIGSGGYVLVLPPQLEETGTEPPWGAEVPRRRRGRRRTGPRGQWGQPPPTQLGG